MRRALSVPAAVIGGVVGIVLLIALVLGLRWVFAEPTGAVQQREQTIGSGAYRISAYDRFFDDCGAARTLQQNLENARTQAADPNVDPTRKAQLDANVTALTNLLNSAVNQYNADAAKTDTRAHFLSSDLPYSLDATQEIRCAA